jgi:ribosomal protein S3AE
MKSKEKKKWIEVEVPLLKKTVDLLAFNKAALNNKVVKIDLTRNLRGKSIEIKFKVRADKEKAEAYPLKLTLLGFFIRRMIRRGTNYVESSFVTECKDATVRVKPFLITRKKVSRAVKNELRKKSVEFLSDYIKEKKLEEIINLIISNSLQKNISLKLKKVYPLSLCEVRVLDVLSRKEIEEEKTEEKPEKKEPEEEKELKKAETEKKKEAKKAERKTKDKTQTKEKKAQKKQ